MTMSVDNPARKRFNLVDAIILIAAIAAGFALGRMVAPSGEESRLTRDSVAAYAVSLALTWAVAILALNLSRYRTTPRDLACRPGFSAVAAILIDRASDILYYAV